MQSIKKYMRSIEKVRNTVTHLLLIACMLALVACGSQSELRPLPGDARILAFGDSLTAGRGVSSENAYPEVLQSLSGRTVINAGVSGELSEEGLQRLPGLLQEYDPHLVILLEGGNDILQNRSLEAAKSNLSAMITLAKDQGADVVLVGVPTKSLFGGSAKFYAELAEEHQIPFEKNIIRSLLKQPAMKSDSVHFNVAGYRALAESINEVLLESGAL